jgi:hypothetical protein
VCCKPHSPGRKPYLSRPIRVKSGALTVVFGEESRTLTRYTPWSKPYNARPERHSNNWNFQFGPEEKSKAAVETSPLIEAIKKSWSRNAR